MTLSASTPAGTPVTPIGVVDGSLYQPGVCNIGPAEIARRRRGGIVAGLIAIVVLAALVWFQVPPIFRLLVALPAAASASGFLQAYFKFCAGFASKGVFNFGVLGRLEQVADAADHARDRARANQILLGSLAIGLLVGVVAVVLPL